MADRIPWPEQVENAGATDDGRFTAAKANQIRSATNNHADHIEALQSYVQSAEIQFGNGSDTLLTVVHNLGRTNYQASVVTTTSRERVIVNVVQLANECVVGPFFSPPSDNQYTLIVW